MEMMMMRLMSLTALSGCVSAGTKFPSPAVNDSSPSDEILLIREAPFDSSRGVPGGNRCVEKPQSSKTVI